MKISIIILAIAVLYLAFRINDVNKFHIERNRLDRINCRECDLMLAKAIDAK